MYQLFPSWGDVENVHWRMCVNPCELQFLFCSVQPECLISPSPHASPGRRKPVLPLLPGLQPLSCRSWAGPFLFNINMLLCWMPRFLLIIQASDACEKCEAGLEDKHSNPVTSSAQGALWVQLWLFSDIQNLLFEFRETEINHAKNDFHPKHYFLLTNSETLLCLGWVAEFTSVLLISVISKVTFCIGNLCFACFSEVCKFSVHLIEFCLL